MDGKLVLFKNDRAEFLDILDNLREKDLKKLGVEYDI
jgi:hypothetical protein